MGSLLASKTVEAPKLRWAGKGHFNELRKGVPRLPTQEEHSLRLKTKGLPPASRSQDLLPLCPLPRPQALPSAWIFPPRALGLRGSYTSVALMLLSVPGFFTSELLPVDCIFLSVCLPLWYESSDKRRTFCPVLTAASPVAAAGQHSLSGDWEETAVVLGFLSWPTALEEVS